MATVIGGIGWTEQVASNQQVTEPLQRNGSSDPLQTTATKNQVKATGVSMKRPEILESARVCVCGEREQDYGTPEDNFSTIGKLWTAYTGVEFTPKDVAIMMALLKIARIKTSDNADSFVDLAGYAACAGEIATRICE